jgi:membrane fusion protein (multidrug efflux system)
VQVVRPQVFKETIFASGNLRANESITLRAERAGIVKEVRFSEGRPVKAGDVLLLIDDAELQAQLAAAQARLELARAVETRDKSLFETKMLSAAEYEQSLANLHVIEADLNLIKAQLEKTRVVAPFDGIAGLRQVSPGAYLSVGASIASLQDVGSLKLDFTVPERYLSYLRPGQSLSFRVAGRAEQFTGVLTAIEPAVSLETRSLQLRASVPNIERKLLPGAFAELRITLDEDPKAILIPAIALVPGLKQQTVYLHKNGVAEERKVQIGLRTSESVQILEGVAPGDELITSGILQLRPGMKIRPKTPATESKESSPNREGARSSPKKVPPGDSDATEGDSTSLSVERGNVLSGAEHA